MRSKCEVNLVTVLVGCAMVQVVCHWPQTTDLPGSSLRLLCMGFVVNKMALEQVLLTALLFSHVIVIPPLFQAYQITHH